MKRLLACLLAALMLCAAAPALAEVIEVTIPHYKSGQNVGALFFLPQVERFNAKYEGKYKIIIEELTQDLYNDKMQQLGIQGKLPALIEGGTLEWLRDVVIPNKLYRDLAPFLAANPEVDSQIPDYQRAYNTMEDGSFVTVTYYVVRPIGMYYNTAMAAFDKEPGEYASWEELLADLGENKIALMTGENAWTTSLIFSSLIAVEEGGLDLLMEHLPADNRMVDFSHPAIINALAKLKALYDGHASANAIGAVYADAANTFMSGGAALIANGTWMVGDFAPSAADKWTNDFDGADVKGAAYPGNVAIQAERGSYGWWIPSTLSDEEAEVAEAFLAHMLSKEEIEQYCFQEGGNPQMWTLSDEYWAKLSQENPVLATCMQAITPETTFTPNFLDVVPSSIADLKFGSLLPQLFDGTYTPEQFAEQLSIMAQEAVED
jgi:raffinose/stachyose/melibiose transport system substrate-binding protein